MLKDINNFYTQSFKRVKDLLSAAVFSVMIYIAIYKLSKKK